MTENEIIEHANKYNCSYEHAKANIQDHELKEQIILQGKIFSFDRSIINDVFVVNNLDSKRRIRYILKGAVGELNYYFRNLWIKENIPNDWKNTLRNFYDEAKRDWFHTRYSERAYRDIAIRIYEAYLEKCFQLLLTIVIQNKGLGEYTKANLIHQFSKSRKIKTIEEIADEMSQELKGEIEKAKLELKARINEKLAEYEYTYPKRSEDFGSSNYEREVMRALENGDGDLYGLG